MNRRKQPNLKEKLAACLLQLLEHRDGRWQTKIDRAWAKDKTPEEIIARFECDHYPMSVFMGGTNHPTNLQWLTKEEHKEKTLGPDRILHNKLRKRKRAAKAPDKDDPFLVAGKRTFSLPELTERQKELKKIVYEQRKLKRKAWLRTLKGKKK
jgi:hypothetical protein